DTSRGYGRFASVWAREPGARWRLLVDLGVTDTLHLPPDVQSKVTEVAPGAICRGLPKGVEARRAALLATDSALAHAWTDTSARGRGLTGVATPELRILRSGRPMVLGID